MKTEDLQIFAVLVKLNQSFSMLMKFTKKNDNNLLLKWKRSIFKYFKTNVHYSPIASPFDAPQTSHL